MQSIESLAQQLHYDAGEVLENLRDALRSATSSVAADQSNRPMAWFGDVVVEFAVTEFLFRRNRGKPLGELDPQRQSLVAKENLASVAIRMGLHSVLDPPISEENARNQPETMEAAFEGVVGALCIDRGIERAMEFVRAKLGLDSPAV